MSVHSGPERRQRRSGYVVRFRDAAGVNRQITLDRKGDAQRLDGEIRRAKKIGPLALAQVLGDGDPLNTWRDDRWRAEHGARLEPSTLARYDRTWTTHVAPELGELPITRVTAEVLGDWQARLLHRGVTTESMRSARTALSTVLSYAAAKGGLPANPLSNVPPPPRGRPRAVRPLPPAAVELVRHEMLQRADGCAKTSTRAREAARDAALVSLMAYGGLRPGELRGLIWDDLRDRTMLIERAVDHTGRVKATKTRHIGTVELLEPLATELDALRDILQPLPGEHLTGVIWDKRDWERWRRTRWRPAVTAAGIEPVPRPYLLRHSFASLLIAAGRSTPRVAEQMRHSPLVTAQVYAHVFDEYRDANPRDAATEINRCRLAAAEPRETRS